MSVRVLHVLPHKGGGAETYIDMLDRMQGFSHDRFYLSGGRTPASAAVSLPTRWPRLAARARAADLIHVHGDVASMVALPLLRLRPAVMTCQGLHMLRRTRGSKRLLITRAVAAVVGSCHAVICSSADERDELSPLLRARDHDKLHVIHNGIDPPPIVDESERKSRRNELGIPDDVVLALFVGQLEPRKAPLLAARAATRAHAAGAPIVLAIAGDGPQAPQLRELEGNAVKMLGYRSDVRELLSAVDLFVHPSEREGMSFALLEAMSQGVAIVAADCSSNPEAIGDTGLLFPARDEAALVRDLIKVCSEPKLRASLGEKAKARVLGRFTPEGFMGETKAVYLRALADVRAPDQYVDVTHA